MALVRRNEWGVLLGLFLVIAATAAMVFFGARMAFFRSAERGQAQTVQATILHVDQKKVYTKGGGGGTPHFKYLVEMNVSGQVIERPLLDANFQPSETWFNATEIDPEKYTVGAVMMVLMRPDLGFRVTPANWWAAYFIPVIFMGFGSLALGFTLVWLRMATR